SFIAISALAAVALADNAPYRPAPYNPAPSYKEQPAAYQYQYAVADDYAGVNFGQNEARDGYATNGEYRVALPDGRTQIVTYNVADAYSGYVADYQFDLFHQQQHNYIMKNSKNRPNISILVDVYVSMPDALSTPCLAQSCVSRDCGALRCPRQCTSEYKYKTYQECRYQFQLFYQKYPILDMQTFITLIALVAVASADNAPYRPAPYSPAPSYKEEPAAYQYQYAVADD
ncbi:hypothetical protein TCAL_12441, partial [Tigriopus californicus]